MDNKEIKKRLMLSSKDDLAERLIMAYAMIKKLEERCLTDGHADGKPRHT